MPKIRQPRGNPSLPPDRGDVVVDLGADFVPSPDKPPVLIYGSSTPYAAAARQAEEAKTNAIIAAPQPVPQIERRQVQVQRSDTDVRSPNFQYVDDFDDPDPVQSMRRTDQRARDRIRQADQAAAEALRWGQQQATIAAAATHEVTRTRLDTVNSAMTAAEAELEAAQAAFAEAWKTADGLQVAKAQTAISDAQYKINTLRDGKDVLEVEVRQPPKPAAPPPLNNNIEAVLASLPNLMEAEREWIREHPESLLDQGNAQAMQVAFRDAEKRGIKRGSAEYFEFFEDRLGIEPSEPEPRRHTRREPDNYEDDDPMPQRQTRRVSAPVSHSGSGGARGNNLRPSQVVLSEQQREFARISGISETDYARGVARLRDEQRRGLYGYSEQK